MKRNKLTIGSDLERVDAHVIQPEEYYEAPELDEGFFERADLYQGDKLIRRGRPPQGAAPKEAIKLRIDPDVLAHFRATGPGWQTRINEALRRAVETPAEAAASKDRARTSKRIGPKAPSSTKSRALTGKGRRKPSARKQAVKRAPAKRA